MNMKIQERIRTFEKCGNEKVRISRGEFPEENSICFVIYIVTINTSVTKDKRVC